MKATPSTSPRICSSVRINSTRLALIGVLLLASSVPLSAGATTIEAANEGFEDGLTGWAAGSGAAVTIQQAIVHSGLNAAALSRKTTSGGALLTDSPDNFVNVPAGNTCNASAWVFGPVGYTGVVRLVAKNGTTTVKTAYKTVSFTGGWQLVPTVTLIMPSTASTADLQVVAPSFPVGQTWYVDDILATCNMDVAPPPPPVASIEDRAIASGLWDGVAFYTYGAYPCDYDRDGLVDVLIEPHNLTSGLRLFHNDGGGSFHQVFAGQFVTRSPSGALRYDFHGCAWGDPNNDGLPDIFCTMGANNGTLTDKADALWIQQPSGDFVDQSAAWGVQNPTGPGRAAIFLDVNHDGLDDLYVSSSNRTDGIESPYRLYINQGGTSYLDSPEYGIDLPLGGLTKNQAPLQAVDYNHDGWMDIFAVTHVGLRVFINNQGTSFTDITPSLRLKSDVWFYAKMIDLNRDGRYDVAGVNNSGSTFRIQMGTDSGFAPAGYTRSVATGRQVAFGDVNADGALDAYIVVGSTTAPDIAMLGSGDGLHWTDFTTPQATTGVGQSVITFDHDQNGADDWIVLSTKGPMQLISFPASPTPTPEPSPSPTPTPEPSP